MEPLASHGLAASADLAGNDHVRRSVRLGQIERLRIDASEVIIDSLLLKRPRGRSSSAR